MQHEYIYEDRVMGCTLEVSLVMENETEASRAYARMLALARAYDAQFSRFIEDSELSQLNREGERQVTEECRKVLLLGRELYRATRGAFNPLVDISRFGYDADAVHVLGNERAIVGTRAAYDIDFSSVRIGADGTVSLSEGQRIDVGGYLKGYVAERLCQEALNASGVIVNLGGDIFTRGRDADGSAFIFSIENPLGDGMPVSFAFEDGGIATSGTYKRRWTVGQKPFHHILDESGVRNPATDVVSATVLAATGHEAEGYATAALVLGMESAAHLLGERGAEYFLIRSDGSSVASAGFSRRVVA